MSTQICEICKAPVSSPYVALAGLWWSLLVLDKWYGIKHRRFLKQRKQKTEKTKDIIRENIWKTFTT